MRLRSQTTTRSPSRGNMSSPTRPATPAASLEAYRSAYNHGTVPGPDGQFDHFLRILHQSHMQTGYWRFSSPEDDRRAYARGFSTPEDILNAQDRSDESYDEISLRWVRGTNDTNMKLPLVGSAAQHLRTIYEARQVLGMSFSFRGQIPLYPISQDARLKQYWESKARQQPIPLKPVHDSPPMAETSTLNAAGLPSSSPQTGPGSQLASDSLHHDDNPSDNARRAQSSAVTPGKALRANTIRRPTVSPLTPPRVSNERRISADISSSMLPSHKPRSKTNGARPYRNIQPRLAEAQATSNASISQRRLETPSRLQVQPPSNSPSSQQVQVSSNSTDVSGHQQISPSSASSSYARPPSWNSTSGVKPPYTPSTRTASVPRQSSSYAPPVSSEDPPSDSPHGQRQNLDNIEQNSTRKLQLRTPINPALAEQQTQRKGVSNDPPLNSKSAPSALLASTSITNTIDNLNLADRTSHGEPPKRSQPKPPTNSSEDATAIAQKKIAKSRHVRLGEPASSAQASPKILEGKAETVHTDSSSKTEQLPPEASEKYPGLPCMDCGEDEGHKWNCHIANLKPMKHLTVLDYRNLADSVHRLDPGPWTTHFDQFPEREPEDAETQVRGMAEVIRNEDSYTNDPELHGLPDDAMILLWAFKTSSAVEVIKE